MLTCPMNQFSQKDIVYDLKATAKINQRAAPSISTKSRENDEDHYCAIGESLPQTNQPTSSCIPTCSHAYSQ